MLFSLRQLEIFLAVAKEQNISRAAEKLCMSQSAASAAIQQLEKQFDVTLFNRSSKSMTLSPVGQSIRGSAQQVLEKALEFQNNLLGQDDQGHLSVGASLTIGNYLGVKYFSKYLMENPNIQGSFQIGNSPEIARKVLNFEIDIGLIESEIQHENIRLIPWRPDKLVIFCSPKHPLAEKKRLKKSDLKKVKWILREAGSATRESFDRAMQGVLHELDIFLELGHNEAIKRAVEAGIGVGCLSSVAIEGNLKHGVLVALSLPGINLDRTFYFALNKNRPITGPVRKWMELCERPL